MTVMSFHAFWKSGNTALYAWHMSMIAGTLNRNVCNSGNRATWAILRHTNVELSFVYRLFGDRYIYSCSSLGVLYHVS